ncbi:MAG: YesL family protein [Suipraeoptans sp.]
MFENLFSQDSKFNRFMTKVMDLIILNVLWFVTSLPIITIGASTTALFTVMQKFVDNEEAYIVKSYFGAFKSNFIQSTLIWIMLMGAKIIFIIDLMIMGRLNGTIDGLLHGAITGIITVLLLLLFLVIIYVFLMQSSYENKMGQTLLKSLVFSVAYFGHTFQIIGMILLPFGMSLMVGMLAGISWYACIIFYVIIGVSVTAYLVSFPWKTLRKKLKEKSLNVRNS